MLLNSQGVFFYPVIMVFFTKITRNIQNAPAHVEYKFLKMYCHNELIFYINVTPVSDYWKITLFLNFILITEVKPSVGAEVKSKLRVIHFSLVFIEISASKNKDFLCIHYILSLYIIIQPTVYFCFLNHLEIANCFYNYLILYLTEAEILKLRGWSLWGDLNFFMRI